MQPNSRSKLCNNCLLMLLLSLLVQCHAADTDPAGVPQPLSPKLLSSSPTSRLLQQQPAAAAAAAQQQDTAQPSSSEMDPLPSDNPAGPKTPDAGVDPNRNPCWNINSGDSGTEYLTVESRCPEDEFNIAIMETNDTWTWRGEDAGVFNDVYFSGGWAITSGFTRNRWIRPRPSGGSSSSSDGGSGSGGDGGGGTDVTGDQFVAVLRVRDRAWVVPKGVDITARKLLDLSSSKRWACVLLGESEDRPFPRFRIVARTDSNHVLANSVAAAGSPIFKGLEGLACEGLRDAVLGYAGTSDPVKGQLVPFYKPTSCKFVIDDCSQ